MPTLRLIADWNPRIGYVPSAYEEVANCGICGSDMHMYQSDADRYILYPGLNRLEIRD